MPLPLLESLISLAETLYAQCFSIFNHTYIFWHYIFLHVYAFIYFSFDMLLDLMCQIFKISS
jgi:hypothetical protein